ncbi:hypothetical protein [Streptomyces sp. NPDC053079]|uniref:hypothetical protein n=1 Tax=Streptomyces sp. NPDC053079 TaxID=3365697 RepID=UPI0037D64A04
MPQSTIASVLVRRVAVLAGVAAAGLIGCAEASAQHAPPAHVRADNTWGNAPTPVAAMPAASVLSMNTWGN